MFICLLCLKQFRGNLKGIALETKLTENLSLGDGIRQQIKNYENLFTTSHSQVSCASCFNCFKSFYELVARVNGKLTGEKIDALPVKLIKDDKKLKVEPLKVDDKNTDKKSFELDSDFEWEMGDDDWSVEEEEPQVTQNSTNYENYKITITENHEVIVKNEPVKEAHRKHPSLDPENEQKIRKFVDIKCYVCDAKFEGENESFSKVKKHFKKFHSSEQGYLMCCDKKYIRRAALLDHIEYQHDKSRIHRCEICEKDYKNKACLKTHNKICHSTFYRERICSVCGKACRNEITLKFHIKTHEVDSSRTFECYKCQKPFKNLHVLKIHVRSAHDRRREVVCEICSATIKSRYFRSHMKIHKTNREKFKCDVCHRWLLKENKVSHMKKHTNLGVNCPQCGKYLKSSLTTHIKIAHSENHRFKCEFCEKSYHKKIKLTEHVAARHTREILFRCRVEGCEKTFRAEGNWKVHEKKFHPEEYDKFFKPSYLRSPDEAM